MTDLIGSSGAAHVPRDEVVTVSRFGTRCAGARARVQLGSEAYTLGIQNSRPASTAVLTQKPPAPDSSM